MAFGKTVVVLLDDATPSDAQGALTLRECLPPVWSPAERDLLLQRPLFAPAAYGRLRFHHRTHEDYLAACWLATLMRQDCPRSELRHLMFAQRADTLTLRPALAPVAAWLATVDAYDALWQRQHRQDLLDAAPWIFLAKGDPRSLPLDYKTEVLRRTAERFKGRGHVSIEWDRPTLKRFADPALAEAVARWITDPTIPEDVRADYVMLIKHGCLHGAMPAVVALAVDEAGGEYLRAIALICVAAIGSPEQRLRVASAFAEKQRIPLRLGVQLVDAVYPRALDECGLFELLGRFDVANSKTRSSSFYTLDAFFENQIDCNQAPLVLRELATFVLDANSALDSARTWALTWLVPLAARTLEAPQLTARTREITLLALRLIEQARERHLHEEYRADDALKRVADCSLAHPPLRRDWFWSKVAAHRLQHLKEPESPWHIDDYYAPIKNHADDLPWWTADIRERPSTSDRLFALRMALHLSAAKRGSAACGGAACGSWLTRRGGARHRRSEGTTTSARWLISSATQSSNARWLAQKNIGGNTLPNCRAKSRSATRRTHIPFLAWLPCVRPGTRAVKPTSRLSARPTPCARRAMRSTNSMACRHGSARWRWHNRSRSAPRWQQRSEASGRP